MKIGVDLDEVLADFLSALIMFHNYKNGTSFRRDHFHSYKVYEIWGGTYDDTIKEIYEFYETKYFDDIKPIPGSIENIEVLSRNNDLVVITSRQNDISQKTLNWIDRYFKNGFSGIFFTNDNSRHGDIINKSQICINSGVDFMIEDYLIYAAECAKSVKKVFLLDSPWNKTDELPKNISRVYSWSEITEDLLEMNRETRLFFDNSR